MLDSPGQLEDGELVIAADIIYFAHSSRMFGEGDQRTDGIRHVGEAASLRAIAEYCYVLPGERLLNEIRNDHPVAPGLARSNCIEQSRNHRRHLLLLPIGDG